MWVCMYVCVGGGGRYYNEVDVCVVYGTIGS